MVIMSSTDTVFFPEMASTSHSNFSFEVIDGRSVKLSPDFAAFIKSNFKTLCTLHPRIMSDDGRFFSLMAPEAQLNNDRNRYPDILPYPPNRFRFRDPLLYINGSIVLDSKASHARGLKKMSSKDFGAWFGSSMQPSLSWQLTLLKVQNENAIATFLLKMENLYPQQALKNYLKNMILR